MRRTGLVAWTVLFGSTAAALVCSENCHVNLAQTWVSVLVGGGKLSALYLAWAAYRDSKNAGVGPSLGEIADQFAIAVGVQWELEVQRRRINDPFPLSVAVDCGRSGASRRLELSCSLGDYRCRMAVVYREGFMDYRSPGPGRGGRRPGGTVAAYSDGLTRCTRQAWSGQDDTDGPTCVGSVGPPRRWIPGPTSCIAGVWRNPRRAGPIRMARRSGDHRLSLAGCCAASQCDRKELDCSAFGRRINPASS